MAKSNAPARRGGRKIRGPRLRKGAMRSAIKNEVKSVLTKASETKFVTFYSGGTGSTNTPYPGAFTPQNGLISTNNSDIKLLVPFTKTGIEDWNRIGSRIQPTRLVVDIDVSLPDGFEVGPTQDINVVIYILSHRTLKDYLSLFANNDFTQLLDSGDGVTRRFAGNAVDDSLPVFSTYYKLHKKIVVPLRSSGLSAPSTAGLPYAIGNNSAPYARRLSIDCTKYLPKTLLYNELNNGGTAQSATFASNSSLFMAVGSYNMGLEPQPATSPPTQFIVQYVSKMSFKDM